MFILNLLLKNKFKNIAIAFKSESNNLLALSQKCVS